jgi:peptidoglycan/LPS O-acetylase OafA/YrhL
MTPPDNLSTLNFMRAFSTVAVVVIHWMGMTGQFPNALAVLPRVVVLMFFVHTGFVLMLSLERQHAASPDKLWRRFMVRRVFRVYPLSTFVLAVILLFRIPARMIPPNFYYVHLGGGGILANFLLGMNLYYCEPLLSPMWSLPYEFQLYLLLPAVYLLLKRWPGFLPVLGLGCLTLVLALL